MNNFKIESDGLCKVRFLPSMENSNFFLHLKLHHYYGHSNHAVYQCGKNHSDKCEICDVYKEGWKKWGDARRNDKALNILRQIKPIDRYYYRILAGDDLKIQFMSMSAGFHKNFIELLIKPYVKTLKLHWFKKFLNWFGANYPTEESYSPLSLDDGHIFLIKRRMLERYPDYSIQLGPQDTIGTEEEIKLLRQQLESPEYSFDKLIRKSLPEELHIVAEKMRYELDLIPKDETRCLADDEFLAELNKMVD